MACGKHRGPAREARGVRAVQSLRRRRVDQPGQADLGITWLCDDSFEDLEFLSSPDVIARKIVEDLAAALAEFEAVATALEDQLGPAYCDGTALTAD